MLCHCHPDQLGRGDVTIRRCSRRSVKAVEERQKPPTAAALTEAARARRHNHIAHGTDTEPDDDGAPTGSGVRGVGSAMYVGTSSRRRELMFLDCALSGCGRSRHDRCLTLSGHGCAACSTERFRAISAKDSSPPSYAPGPWSHPAPTAW